MAGDHVGALAQRETGVGGALRVVVGDGVQHVEAHHGGELADVDVVSAANHVAEADLGGARQVNPARLSFDDIAASRAYLDTIAAGLPSAKGALEVALHDGAARKATARASVGKSVRP